jgi:plastocyanin
MMNRKLTFCALALGACLLAGGAPPLPGAAAAGAATLATAAGAADSPAAAAEIKIDNFSFNPASIRVAAGTAVTWVNHDDIPHNVMSTDKIFKSKALDTDDRFSYTFAKPGRYPYFCGLHPKMTGEVIVQ